MPSISNIQFILPTGNSVPPSSSGTFVAQVNFNVTCLAYRLNNSNCSGHYYIQLLGPIGSSGINFVSPFYFYNCGPGAVSGAQITQQFNKVPSGNYFLYAYLFPGDVGYPHYVSKSLYIP